MDVKFLKGTLEAYQALSSNVDEGTFYLCDNGQEDEGKKYRLYLGKTEITADGQIQDVIQSFNEMIGSTESLTTSEKTSIVTAINSIITVIGGNSTSVEGLDDKNIITVLKELKEKIESDESSLKVTVEDTTDTAGSDSIHKQYTVKQGGQAVQVPINIDKIKMSNEGLVYTLTQGDTEVGKITIPKDLVVESGKVVTEEGSTYIELTLNDPEQSTIKIDVKDLIDIYTAAAGATEVQLKVDKTEDGHVISATLVNGGVTTEKIKDGAVTNVKLAANAVKTSNIEDKAVTNDKLDDALQQKLKDMEAALTWGTFPVE